LSEREYNNQVEVGRCTFYSYALNSFPISHLVSIHHLLCFSKLVDGEQCSSVTNASCVLEQTTSKNHAWNTSFDNLCLYNFMNNWGGLPFSQ
jgi:hypothetical protein